MEWFWLCLTIALIVIEVTSTQLVSIWFAAGSAVTAIITALAPIELVWQILIFVAVSVALLLSTRRLVRKLLKTKTESQQTNLELYIGREAIVVEDINNIAGAGAVKINGITWSAKSLDGNDIKQGEIVVFKEIKGNKAIVARKD